MNLLNSLKTLTLALILSIGIGYAYAAWAPPTAAPTSGNAEAPVNVGSATQIKAGGLGINGLLNVVGKVVVSGTIKVGDNSGTTATCDSTTRGAIKYDGADFFGCAASGWKSLTVTGGGPTGGGGSGSATYDQYKTTPETFIVPSGVTSLTVEVWGGGGGGGYFNTVNSGYYTAGGGGGGGYAKSTFIVTPGTGYHVVVGNSGKGGTLCFPPAVCTADGQMGGTSSFSLANASVPLVSAPGGAGGRSGGQNMNGGGGGAGGNPTNGNILNTKGGNGANGNWGSTAGGAPGGVGGIGANGGANGGKGGGNSQSEPPPSNVGKPGGVGKVLITW